MGLGDEMRVNNITKMLCKEAVTTEFKVLILHMPKGTEENQEMAPLEQPLLLTKIPIPVRSVTT
jgi:hypothetical protein